MKTSLSFLATDITQMPRPGHYYNTALEAVSFNRADLQKENWELIWKNLEKACNLYGAVNVTYHFPMNNSDYVEDAFVHDKLREAYQRANNVGLAGVVVHSNRIKTFEEWKKLDIAIEQERVIDRLRYVADSVGHSSLSWLGLENMPLVGNSGHDMDPLFCFGVDFKTLPKNIGIVWDICHSTSTVAYVQAHRSGKLSQSLVLRDISADYYDFKDVCSSIRHWHFAGFEGLNDPGSNGECIEGIVPSRSRLGEVLYSDLLKTIAQVARPNAKINFEIQESDYIDRVNGPDALEWADALLSGQA